MFSISLYPYTRIYTFIFIIEIKTKLLLHKETNRNKTSVFSLFNVYFEPFRIMASAAVTPIDTQIEAFVQEILVNINCFSYVHVTVAVC